MARHSSWNETIGQNCSDVASKNNELLGNKTTFSCSPTLLVTRCSILSESCFCTAATLTPGSSSGPWEMRGGEGRGRERWPRVTRRVSTPPKRALSQKTLTMALGTHFHRLEMILLVWRAQICNATNLILKKVILVTFPRRPTRITYFVVCAQYARVRMGAYFSRRSDSTHNRTDTSRSFSRLLQSGFGLSSFF